MNRLSDCRSSHAESRQRAFDWRCEPDVDTVLAEPIVRLMMARDGVSPQQVMTLVHRVRHAAVNGKN